ncbi:MAG: tRNA glutamyl-Q(34) synthetase GluQRS [Cellvibrionales bacterium TMED49]|nr:tRNA glutamyl-Q(34) synthetase GluQRS [Porticoccaceae bacterium]OUU39333.1 MAG: tRNA glutamyl-Q(34) synthetase GluQRS [Cellvibrionales bacterium TMED49]|tara:strand:+ start:422 stop:1333 length:912 start_codon:yes stop_codon:yes gene_type:complete
MSLLKYIGRFAPSPSGPLHLGSLVCALASYLDAKKSNGVWLLRIEDLDPPREDARYISTIQRQLDMHGLHWDGEIFHQSNRLAHYQDILEELKQKNLAYDCECHRKRIKEIGGIYDGRCRRKTKFQGDISTRLLIAKNDETKILVTDRVFGDIHQDIYECVGDFILKRRDGFFSYQLASVVDDEQQQITHVVRGNDLLPVTPRQKYLQKCLNYRSLKYAHIPLIVNQNNQKLSKQRQAPAVRNEDANKTIWYALKILNQKPPSYLFGASLNQILSWAVSNWDMSSVPRQNQSVLNGQSLKNFH